MRPLLAKPVIRGKLQPFFEVKPNGSVLAFHAADDFAAGRGKSGEGTARVPSTVARE